MEFEVGARVRYTQNYIGFYGKEGTIIAYKGLNHFGNDMWKVKLDTPVNCPDCPYHGHSTIEFGQKVLVVIGPPKMLWEI